MVVRVTWGKGVPQEAHAASVQRFHGNGAAAAGDAGDAAEP